MHLYALQQAAQERSGATEVHAEAPR